VIPSERLSFLRSAAPTRSAIAPPGLPTNVGTPNCEAVEGANILLDELFDVHTHVPNVFVAVRVDFFPFQRLHEAFAASVPTNVIQAQSPR
jgi:hypothetical protein